MIAKRMRTVFALCLLIGSVAGVRFLKAEEGPMECECVCSEMDCDECQGTTQCWDDETNGCPANDCEQGELCAEYCSDPEYGSPECGGNANPCSQGCGEGGIHCTCLPHCGGPPCDGYYSHCTDQFEGGCSDLWCPIFGTGACAES